MCGGSKKKKRACVTLLDQSNAGEEIVDLNQKVTNPSTHIRMYCC